MQRPHRTARALLLPSLVAAMLAWSCAGPGPGRAADPASAGNAGAPGRGLNDRFLSPDLDIEWAIKTFEKETREVVACKERLVELLELRPGMAVADVGAGTGLFLSSLAAAVGPGGTVHAVDISPKLVEYMRERVAREKLGTVTVTLSSQHTTRLAPASVNAVLVCDTYHHFEDPAAMLASIRDALRPGGRLVIVDFERIPGRSRKWILGHVRAGKDTVIAEVERAGFELIDAPEPECLEENYVIRFRRGA